MRKVKLLLIGVIVATSLIACGKDAPEQQIKEEETQSVEKVVENITEEVVEAEDEEEKTDNKDDSKGNIEDEESEVAEEIEEKYPYEIKLEDNSGNEILGLNVPLDLEYLSKYGEEVCSFGYELELEKKICVCVHIYVNPNYEEFLGVSPYESLASKNTLKQDIVVTDSGVFFCYKFATNYECAYGNINDNEVIVTWNEIRDEEIKQLSLEEILKQTFNTKEYKKSIADSDYAEEELKIEKIDNSNLRQVATIPKLSEKEINDLLEDEVTKEEIQEEKNKEETKTEIEGKEDNPKQEVVQSSNDGVKHTYAYNETGYAINGIPMPTTVTIVTTGSKPTAGSTISLSGLNESVAFAEVDAKGNRPGAPTIMAKSKTYTIKNPGTVGLMIWLEPWDDDWGGGMEDVLEWKSDGSLSAMYSPGNFAQIN